MNVIISSNSTHWTLIFQFSTYFERIMSIFGKNHKILFITLKPLWIDAATWLNSMYSRHVFTLENINRKWPTFVCMQTESDFFTTSFNRVKWVHTKIWKGLRMKSYAIEEWRCRETADCLAKHVFCMNSHSNIQTLNQWISTGEQTVESTKQHISGELHASKCYL